MMHTQATDRLILASASPRRRELLERVGITVEIIPANSDETPHGGESAVAYAVRVAQDKAAAVAAKHPQRWVLAADTVVELDGEILGKAADAANAVDMLGRLLGRTHQVTTGFCLQGPGGQVVADRVTSDVTMRAASQAEIEEYVASGEWVGKAGAYAIQGIASALVHHVHGSITNVVGLPLCQVIEVLRSYGAAATDYRRGVPA